MSFTDPSYESQRRDPSGCPQGSVMKKRILVLSALLFALAFVTTEATAERCGWRPLGGSFPAGAPVAVVSRNPNQLDLFVTGNDGKVYTSWWSQGSEWSGINNNWRLLGGLFPAGAPVAAVSRNPNQLDLFVTGNDGKVYTSWWSLGLGWSGINNNWRPLGGSFPAGAGRGGVAQSKPVRPFRHRQRRQGLYELVVPRVRVVGHRQ
jgi:hypothetical protein